MKKLSFDPAPAEELDDLAALAGHLCAAPMALIEVLDADRIRVVGRIGLEVPDRSGKGSFCERVLAEGELIVISDPGKIRALAEADAAVDARVRLCAGAPLYSRGGLPLGAISVMDWTDRPFSEEAGRWLHLLARQAEANLDRFRLTAELAQRKADPAKGQTSIEEVVGAGPSVPSQIINSLPGVFYIVDSEGRFRHWNANVETVSGYSAEEISKMHPLQFFRDCDQALVAERLALIFQEGEASVEAPLQQKSGESIPYFFYGRRIEIKGIPHLMGMGFDISERERAEAARRESEEKYRSLVEGAQDAIFSISPEGLLKSVNPAFERITGWPGDEWLEKPFSSLLRPEDVPAVTAAFDQVLGGGSPSGFELSVNTQSGESVPMEFVLTPHRSEERVVAIFGIARDIRARKYLEERFRQVQKLDSVGQLAAGIAHDFNNLLTIQQGYLSILLEQADTIPQLLEPVEEMVHATDRATHLTKQLLLFSRKQAMQRVALNLGEVVDGMTKFLGRILGEDIELDAKAAPGLPAVLADRGMMEQVLMNLGVNARDAMPDGGRLSIRTAVAQVDAQAGQSAEARSGQFVRLTVRDNGTGIPPELLDRLFEPFVTTKDVGKGTGLGLATVYGIVKQHQGWIEAESEPGKGAAFRIYLPISGEAPVKETKERPARSQIPGTGKRELILVVEDETSVRTMVEMVLKTQGYQVLSAGSGKEAIDIWTSREGEIDLLLTDMVMPEGMSGRDLAIHLKESRPDLKIIYTSGYDPEAVKMDRESAYYLQKPYAAHELIDTVRTCLGAEKERA